MSFIASVLIPHHVAVAGDRADSRAEGGAGHQEEQEEVGDQAVQHRVEPRARFGVRIVKRRVGHHREQRPQRGHADETP
jgi:hypothetical protein